MSSRNAAPRVAAPKAVTASLAMLLSPARAEASRQNGARSRGPKTPEGKARSAQNALKHGLRAQKYVVLPEEDAAEFEALEQEIIQELAPVGALQTALAQRVVAATWRLARAERLEADIFEIERRPGKSLGLALIRDCNGARAFGTLLRYRGGTLAELWRALRTLKALQAERAATREAAPAPQPDEPEARAIAGDSRCAPVAAPMSRMPETPAPARRADLEPLPAPAPRVAARALEQQPDEPERPADPRNSGPSCAAGSLPPRVLELGGQNAADRRDVAMATQGRERR